MYAFFAMAIFLAADCVIVRGSLRGSAVALLFAVGAAAVLSAVMVLPGLELTGESVRAGADYSKDAGASLTAGRLATLVSPDHYGALVPEHYTGPPDITQFYFYMGILLVPLALLGLTAARERWYGLALTVAGLWYAMGPAGGLYQLVGMLPGFRSVRAPVQMWFVAALGLALLAAAGVGVLRGAFSFAVDCDCAVGDHGSGSVLLEYGAQRNGVLAGQLPEPVRQSGRPFPHGGGAADPQRNVSHLGGERFAQFRTAQRFAGQPDGGHVRVQPA